MPLTNELRREQSVLEIRRLAAAMEDWLRHRRAHDCDAAGHYVGRHFTQLNAIESALKGAADALQGGLRALDPSHGAGEFYDECRDFDVAAVWLRRLWEFYRDKFDQRDDPELGPVLLAADEIVWSCYHGVMTRAATLAPGVAHGAAPLAYVSPDYSPAALDARARLGGVLGSDLHLPSADKSIRERMASLPLPLLRLPPWCVRAPWWLVHVAHEVGHHIYAALDLTAHVRGGIEQRAAQGPSRYPATRWRNWSEEIFADVFAVLMLGGAAAAAVAEIERGAPARMGAPGPLYPSPAVRVALLFRAAECLNLAAAFPAEQFVEAALGSAVQSEIAVISAIVEFLLNEELPRGLGTLRDLCATGAAPADFAGQCAYWTAALARHPLPGIPAAVETARYVTAGAVGGWRAIAVPGDAASRLTALQSLAQASMEALARSAAPGTRAGFQPDGDVPGAAESLATGLAAAARRRRTRHIGG